MEDGGTLVECERILAQSVEVLVERLHRSVFSLQHTSAHRAKVNGDVDDELIKPRVDGPVDG